MTLSASAPLGAIKPLSSLDKKHCAFALIAQVISTYAILNLGRQK